MAALLVGSTLSGLDSFGQISVNAQDYLYYGTLSIEAYGWKSYNVGLNYDMTGGTLGTLYEGAKLAVIEKKLTNTAT